MKKWYLPVVVDGIFVCIFAGLHWLGATAWVALQKTSYCLTTLEEGSFNIVLGFVYCFYYINIKNGHSHWRVATFYMIMFVENAVLVLVWYANRSHYFWHDELTLAVVFTTFCLGELLLFKKVMAHVISNRSQHESCRGLQVLVINKSFTCKKDLHISKV